MHRCCAALAVFVLTTLFPASVGRASQSTEWTLIDSGEQASVYYRGGDRLAIYVEVRHKVAPGDFAIEILEMQDFAPDEPPVLWRRSTCDPL